MKKITKEYGLNLKGYNQYNVDFVDLYLGIDNLLFLDYNKILLGNTQLHKDMQKDIQAFMKSMFDFLSKNQNTKLSELLSGLHETNATYLGMSKDVPKGKSVGNELKKEILKNLKFLKKAFLNGLLEIDSIYFGIENIGPDRISDIVTSIIKMRLIEFTQQECIKYKIPTQKLPIKRIFDSSTLTWQNVFVDLPLYNNKPVIFIPKDIVSTYSSISGTFHSFIRYGFNTFFKTSKAYKILVRGKDGKLDTDLKRKEFNEYNRELGINQKSISQKILTEFDNKDLVKAFSEVRNSVNVLSDDELIEIIENSLKRAN
ncbi:hypothetical protein [Flavobacterium beibuense]|uniref:hypothetical protein n=1 Tax=Flavobacterium beibuense TaxID=657326 RepID=UPI003A90CBE3